MTAVVAVLAVVFSGDGPLWLAFGGGWRRGRVGGGEVDERKLG